MEGEEALFPIKRVFCNIWERAIENSLIVHLHDQRVFTSHISLIRTETLHSTRHHSRALFFHVQFLFLDHTVCGLQSLDLDFRGPDDWILNFNVVFKIVFSKVVVDELGISPRDCQREYERYFRDTCLDVDNVPNVN